MQMLFYMRLFYITQFSFYKQIFSINPFIYLAINDKEINVAIFAGDR
jgi:hypothetical protein